MSLPERKVKGKTSIKGAIFEVDYQKWVPNVRLIEKNLSFGVQTIFLINYCGHIQS